MFIFYAYAGILIGVLIVVHEVGHFLAARAARVTVERFSIGFGPKILKVKRGQTEYVLSLIPLGGYVKMAGTETSEHPAGETFAPDTFPGKPIGVRALIIAAGPLANVIWALLVYVGIIWIGGVPTFGDQPIVGMVEEGSPAEVAGISALDRIVSVDGAAVATWDDLRAGIQSADITDGITIALERPEEPALMTLVVDVEPDSLTGAVAIGVAAYIPPLIGDVMAGSPADVAGLKQGDRVTALNGQPVRTWYELSSIVAASPNQELLVSWERDGETGEVVLTVDEVQEPIDLTEVRNVGSIGTTVPLMMRKIGFGEALFAGVGIFAATAGQVVGMFWMIVTGQISMDMVGGPIRVVQMASESARWGASYFFAFMAFLSLNLAIINLLPLPILDGGHLLLLALERLRGRGLTERQLLVWQQIGLFFFIGLAAFLLVRDVFLLR